MKKTVIASVILIICTVAGVLTGCNSTDTGNTKEYDGPLLWNVEGASASDSGQAGNGTSADARIKITKELLDMGAQMPVLAIQTKKTGENSLDFITEPVVHHVALEKASWTPGYVLPPEPYYKECRVSLIGQDRSVLIDNADASVKVRGNWTTDYDKKPLRIRFEEKKNLLGLNNGREYKNWVLMAEYKDASMLRNKTALEIARELLGADGYYAADAELVQVAVNGQYWGVYLLTELQQVNKGRVEITEPKEDYQGTDIGYFFEMDGYFEDEEPLHKFHVSYADNASLIPLDGNDGGGRTMKPLPENSGDPKKDIGMSIKSDVYSQEQHDFLEAYVENVFEIMYEAAYNGEAYVFNEDYTSLEKTDALSPREAVERAVDLDSLVDTFLLSELTCDADIYYSSFYMSVDFGPKGNKKLTFQAPWDFDSGLGNKNRCKDGTGYYAANIVPDVNGETAYGGEYFTINPWLAVLANEAYFQELATEKWTEAYDNGVFDRAISEISAVSEKYAVVFEKNYERWDNIRNNSGFAGELSDRAAGCKNQGEAAAYLAEWLNSRVEFLNGEWHR